MEAKAKFEVGQEVYLAISGPSRYEDCPICYEGISNRLKSVKKHVVVGIMECKNQSEDFRYQYFLDPNKFSNIHLEKQLFATREEAEKACFENNHQNDHFPFVKMVLDELDAAKAKHPHFADTFFLSMSEHIHFGIDKDKAEGILDSNRKSLSEEIKNGKVTTNRVMMCEYAEFADEVVKGNWNAALIELAQVGAVVIRTARAVQAKIDERSGENVLSTENTENTEGK